MKNFLLTLMYDGTDYCGWQTQKNGATVQQTVTETLETVIGELPKGINGCSRTDSGVHANKYCCSFLSNTTVAPENIVKALNSRLPKDISAIDCVTVDLDFHARFSCTKKQYIYKFYVSNTRNPFLEGYSFRLLEHPDLKKLNEWCSEFVGIHDFSSFCSSGSSVTDNNREIYSCGVIKQGNEYIFEITGNGFLYNMVRIIVGTLLDKLNGKLNERTVTEIIESKNREFAGKTAPPYALYLNDVFYS